MFFFSGILTSLYNIFSMHVTFFCKSRQIADHLSSFLKIQVFDRFCMFLRLVSFYVNQLFQKSVENSKNLFSISKLCPFLRQIKKLFPKISLAPRKNQPLLIWFNIFPLVLFAEPIRLLEISAELIFVQWRTALNEKPLPVNRIPITLCSTFFALF